MPFNCNLLECFPIVSSSLFFYNTINSKRNTTMRHHSFSTFTPLIVAAIALFAGKLSVQASIFSFENERRGLIAKNSNNDISLTSDDDDSTGAPETIKKKGSIASRTSSVASTKKSSLMGPGEMGVQFVKPETAAPSVVPPTTKKDSTTKSSQSISSNSTSTSSSTPAANKTVSSPSTSPKTFYPTSAGVDSIASRTSNTADSTKVPISASMEFDKAETASPSLIQHTSNDGINSPKNTSSASIEDSDTQGDQYTKPSDINIYDDDSDSTLPSNNFTFTVKHQVFPKEKSQPKQWPEIVVGIFVVAAVAFFGATAFKNRQKRKGYLEIPMSLNV